MPRKMDKSLNMCIHAIYLIQTPNTNPNPSTNPNSNHKSNPNNNPDMIVLNYVLYINDTIYYISIKSSE